MLQRFSCASPSYLNLLGLIKKPFKFLSAVSVIALEYIGVVFEVIVISKNNSS